jgi:cytochrome c-type biogenesis protein CcmE
LDKTSSDSKKGKGELLRGIWKKKFFTAAAVLIIASCLGYLLWGGLEQNLVYFVTPTELLAKGDKAIGNPVRLGGVVAANSVRFASNTLSFEIADDHNKIPVETTKTPPQMFQEEMGVVVEGELRPDRKFNAERLMVKHGNEYRPPKEGEMPQEIYKALRRQ